MWFCLCNMLLGMNWVVLLLISDASQVLRWRGVLTLELLFSALPHSPLFGFQIFIRFQRWYASLKLFLFVASLMFYYSVNYISLKIIFVFFLLIRFSISLIYMRYPLIFLAKRMIALILLLWWMALEEAVLDYKMFILLLFSFPIPLCFLSLLQI